MLRFATFAAFVVLSTACQGPTGPQGPAGPTGPSSPYDRAKVYCTGGGFDVNGGNGWSLTASCHAAADTPVEGWCFEPGGLPSGAYLSNSQPVSWADPAAIAGWRCTWSWHPGSTETTFAGQAEICCAAP